MNDRFWLVLLICLRLDGAMARTANEVEVIILAGGLSTRMGRDKSRVRLGRRTLLGHVRAAALATGLPVRVIRKDVVPRCGPLGGILTALRRARTERVLLLSCDQPMLTADFLRWFLVSAARGGKRGSFVYSAAEQAVGFPFVLPVEALPVVEAQVVACEFSLQRLARVLRAKRVKTPHRFVKQLANLNTPGDLERARLALR